LVVSNVNYEKVVISTLNKELSAFYPFVAAAPADYALTKFTDLGPLQYGTGNTLLTLRLTTVLAITMFPR
jgi:hypothetical protein